MAIHLPLGSVRGTLSGKTLRPGFALEASGLEPHSCGVAGWPSKGWPLLMMRPMAVFWCGRSAIVRCMSGKSRCAPAQLRNRRVLDVSLSNRVVYLSPADKYHRLTRRLLKEQKVL